MVVVRDREFEAHPLPWMKRNDLGNEIMRQYSELLNSSMRAYTSEDTSPQLELYLNDKVQDPIQLIKLGYPSWRDEDFLNDLDYDELLELIFASLEVNRLESLRDLVDPNSNTP
ncbi:MAG TPA: hypothetical protein VFK94_00055, partial [Patescibacteria group bacterium]|nr:hypothetical protein [Patescibacteria group bacterium]